MASFFDRYKKRRVYRRVDKGLNGVRGGEWWWNADVMIALVVAAACRHVRVDGIHAFSAVEVDELFRLEDLALVYAAELEGSDEFWELFRRWMPRLWD